MQHAAFVLDWLSQRMMAARQVGDRGQVSLGVFTWICKRLRRFEAVGGWRV